MGLFNFDFLQDAELGADAPRRKNIFLYTEIFFRKFFKLMKSNLLYFLVSLPIVLIVYFFAPVEYFVKNIIPANFFDAGFVNSAIPQIRLLTTALFMLFFGSGPASAGYAYILRCFTRENHVWLWTEFWEKFRENLKQGLITLLIALVGIPLMLTAIFVYFKLSQTISSSMYSILLYILGVLFLMVILAHTFIYQIMITYDCNIRMLYKNSFLMVLARFPITLINISLGTLITVLIFTWLHPIAAVFFYIFFGYGFSRFPSEFYAARVIERMIKDSEPENDDYDEEDSLYE